MFRVYKIVFEDERVYIGMTSQSLKTRLIQHRCLWIGKKECSIVLLHEVRSFEKAKQLEIDEIHGHDAMDESRGHNQKADFYSSHLRKKLSEAAKKRVNEFGVPFLGQTHTQETRRKMSKAKKGKVPPCSGHNSVRVRNEQTGEVFPTIQAACETYGLHKASLSRCVLGKQKTCGGYEWKRLP